MPNLEDSGIDSEDKQSNVFDEVEMQLPNHQLLPSNLESVEHKTAEESAKKQHMADMMIAFRGVANSSTDSTSDGKPTSSMRPLVNDDVNDGIIRAQVPSTCRILQRKLELKVERAKRNYNQYQEEQARKSQAANLIPITRLPIPGDGIQRKPLVDYKTDSSDNEAEEISFFPAKLRKTIKQRNSELSDTFSLREMTIDSDLDSDESGSQSLELIPPEHKRSFVDQMKTCFGCLSW